MTYSVKDDFYLGLDTEAKPSSAKDGEKYYEVNTKQFFIYYNSQWWPM